MPMSAGASLWALAHVRRRLAVIILLGLLAGIAGAATLTAVAGARRAASSYTRYTEATDAPHVVVSTFTAADRWKPSDQLLAPLAELPGVTEWTRLATILMRPEGSDAYSFDTFNFGATDTTFAADIRRFQLVEGRRFDDTRDDEVVLSTRYAEEVGVGVGDEVTFEAWTQDYVDALFAGESLPSIEPTGPSPRVTVVGITREFQPLLPFVDDPLIAYFPAAFTHRWEDEVGIALPVGLALLESGPGRAAEFESAALAEAGSIDPRLVDGLMVEVPSSIGAGVQTSIDAQVTALVAFALIAGVAGTFVTYAALRRQLTFASDDQSVLRVLGMTRLQRIVGVMIIGAPIALAAATISVAGASLASGLLPIGTPGDLEPHTGVRLDVPALAIGAVGIVLVLLALVAATGFSLTRPRAEPSRTASPGLATSIASWFGLWPPVSLGVGMALGPGRGGRSLPVRTTIAGCVIGLAGATAALAFAASLDQLVSTPRLYGWAPDAGIEGGTDQQEWNRVLGDLEADPDIDELTSYTQLGYLSVNDEPVFALLYEPTRGDTLNVIVSGRAPQAHDELVMGSAVADELDVAVGDTVSVALADGANRPYELVGIAAHPPIIGTYREHVALLADTPEEFATTDDAPTLGAVISFHQGADVDAALDALRAQDLAVYDQPGRPRAVASLDEIIVFPRVLAFLLTLLAATSLLYALSTGLRRRGRELAVLRALGFSSAQLRLVSVSQALAPIVIGIAVGVPIGFVAGRLAWTVLTGRLGVVVDHALPGVEALWVAGAIVAVVVASAAVNRRTIRTRPATLLRAGERE